MDCACSKQTVKNDEVAQLKAMVEALKDEVRRGRAAAPPVVENPDAEFQKLENEIQALKVDGELEVGALRQELNAEKVAEQHMEADLNKEKEKVADLEKEVKFEEEKESASSFFFAICLAVIMGIAVFGFVKRNRSVSDVYDRYQQRVAGKRNPAVMPTVFGHNA